jgi:osmotically-inducible protein OsmY
MKLLIASLVLLTAISMPGQQQDDRSHPWTQNTPPSTSEQPAGMSNADVRHEIQSRLSTNNELNNTEVTATVTDDTVVLDGYVDNQQQHSLAVGIAQEYTDGRRLVDRIKTGGVNGF